MTNRDEDATGTLVAAKPTAQRALEALKSLAQEKGLDDVSMRDVARRLGLSLAALQYHYPNKAALLEAFVRQTVASYRERIETVLAVSAEGEHFASLVRFAAMETVHWDNHGVMAMIEGRASHDDAARNAILLFFRSYLDIMRDALMADSPGLPPAKALLTATLVISMLEGLPTLIEPAGDLGIDRDALVDAIIRAAKMLSAGMM
ncbi:TetR/AcrR family transcriptional regulator [Phreatobacter sp.]|uniref:TetR/AcrR family transcriptional regulator n=1 Tax=Phreatobacter sp. TaxID=1966341 RepID=UPI0022C0C237|nr:TetR/AcrR family transcriptional regulator [Phreatobacter sp.]MCZ8314134.1 TetR/AcrR family transcriptional regulator [Phreatobacter sp.]